VLIPYLVNRLAESQDSRNYSTGFQLAVFHEILSFWQDVGDEIPLETVTFSIYTALSRSTRIYLLFFVSATMGLGAS
jgi:hypothetical protein